MNESFNLAIALIFLLGISAQWLAWLLRAPSILFLLFFGILAGPVLGLINPDEQFGSLLFPIVSLGVAIVLFEGALTLKFEDIKGHGRLVTNLVSWGALMNWGFISLGAWYFLGLSAELAILFGALVIVTGPTVVAPLLKSVRPVPSISEILRWEGILIDPIGALLTVLVYEYIVSQASGNSLLLFGEIILVGTGIGAAGALFMTQILRRQWIPEYLRNVFTFAMVIIVFTCSNSLAHESGLLTVTVMGIWLANVKNLDIHDILNFKESLSILVVSLLFILLAARLNLDHLAALGWMGAGAIAIVLLARPFVIWAVSIGSELSWREKALISWIAPRGIVAAAISSLFAIKLNEMGYADAESIATLTFLVIIVTVLLQSLTARPLARFLKVAEEKPRGVLIIGANRFSRALGLALSEFNYRVKVVDGNWKDIQAARMAGLDTYFGNPVSTHADTYLDTVGVGKVLALSWRPALNALVCTYFARDIGQQNVYAIRHADDKVSKHEREMTPSLRSNLLFSQEETLEKLASLIGQGGEIKATPLTESFGSEEYFSQYEGKALLLCAIDPNEELHIQTEEQLPIGAGWTIISLIPKTTLEKNSVRNGKETQQKLSSLAPAN